MSLRGWASVWGRGGPAGARVTAPQSPARARSQPRHRERTTSQPGCPRPFQTWLTLGRRPLGVPGGVGREPCAPTEGASQAVLPAGHVPAGQLRGEASVWKAADRLGGKAGSSPLPSEGGHGLPAGLAGRLLCLQAWLRPCLCHRPLSSPWSWPPTLPLERMPSSIASAPFRTGLPLPPGSLPRMPQGRGRGAYC